MATIDRIALGRGALGVNCYLVRTADGFVLVDSGIRGQRGKLLEQLDRRGCRPGALRLLLITHGDADHIGNVRALREVYGMPVAMHEGDAAMASTGDSFAGRKTRPGAIVRALIKLLGGLKEQDRFEPDLLVDEDSDLSDFGLAGSRVLLLEGHSAGSIALLLDDGSLLCGDVLENRSQPKLGSIMDDVPTAERSVERLRGYEVRTVYPGHGTPFDFSELAGGGTKDMPTREPKESA